MQYKTERIQAAAAEILPLLTGTPIPPADFEIRKGYNGLLGRAVIRRAWASVRGKTELTGAIDNLITELEK